MVHVFSESVTCNPAFLEIDRYPLKSGAPLAPCGPFEGVRVGQAHGYLVEVATSDCALGYRHITGFRIDF